LAGEAYPVLWVDALYEKVRYGGRVVNMAIQIVCGINAQGRREVLAVEPMLEESKDTYQQLIEGLKARGLLTPSLVVTDAHKGLIAAIRTSSVGASWQRCKVHFMRNILAHIPHRDKAEYAGQLKEIWLAPSAEGARARAAALVEAYTAKYPKAIETLEDGLEDSLSFYAFPKLDARKIASTNMLERLNEEIRRRTRVVGIFPNPDSYLRLVTTFLMEFADDWSISRAYLSEESIRTLLPQAA
jgi:transposase-like protein